MANDLQHLALIEKSSHLKYVIDYKILFLNYQLSFVIVIYVIFALNNVNCFFNINAHSEKPKKIICFCFYVKTISIFRHRPFSCFYWHFQNQRRRRPFRRKDGTFSYDPDFYCNDYDEQSGVCPNGDE
jgi:hypothetical protein